MIFRENCLPADDSHEISYLFFLKLEKMSQNVPSAAVVIGALFNLIVNRILMIRKTPFHRKRKRF